MMPTKLLPAPPAATSTLEKFDILVAEDDALARNLIASIFDEARWPRPAQAADGAEALERLRRGRWDILITDLNMPRMSGEELIERALDLHPNLTVIVLTANGTIDRAVSLMKKGAFDFLTKPYAIDNFVSTMSKAQWRVLHLHEMQGMRAVVNALLVALESKDRYLQGHASRVSSFAVAVGRRLGLPRDELKYLEYAALLHDVGKIGVHEDILNKPGKLTVEEFAIMKRHPVMSHDILAPVAFLKPCLPAVLHHHERIDGKGYPAGIAGEKIPLGARIIGVVDTFDAMSSARSYRDAIPIDRVLRTMHEVSGTQLDARIVRVFLSNLEAITGQSQGGGA